MVENAVQHHLHARAVNCFAHSGKIFVCAKARVQRKIIARVIAVRVAFPHRVEQHGPGAQAFDVLHPAQKLPDARPGLAAAVLRGRATQAKGINLVYHRVFPPHSIASSLLFLMRPAMPPQGQRQCTARHTAQGRGRAAPRARGAARFAGRAAAPAKTLSGGKQATAHP